MLLGHCIVSGAHGARWRVGFWGHVEAMWLSDKHTSQRAIDLALPVNASLYRQEFGTDQFKSFLASASRLYYRS